MGASSSSSRSGLVSSAEGYGSWISAATGESYSREVYDSIAQLADNSQTFLDGEPAFFAAFQLDKDMQRMQGRQRLRQPQRPARRRQPAPVSRPPVLR